MMISSHYNFDVSLLNLHEFNMFFSTSQQKFNVSSLFNGYIPLEKISESKFTNALVLLRGEHVSSSKIFKFEHRNNLLFYFFMPTTNIETIVNINQVNLNFFAIVSLKIN